MQNNSEDGNSWKNTLSTRQPPSNSKDVVHATAQLRPRLHYFLCLHCHFFLLCAGCDGVACCQKCCRRRRESDSCWVYRVRDTPIFKNHPTLAEHFFLINAQTGRRKRFWRIWSRDAAKTLSRRDGCLHQ